MSYFVCSHTHTHIYVQSLGSYGVYVYQPHTRTITDLAISSSQALPSSHLLSTSTDGTLRSTDFEKGVLDLVSCEIIAFVDKYTVLIY